MTVLSRLLGRRRQRSAAAADRYAAAVVQFLAEEFAEDFPRVWSDRVAVDGLTRAVARHARNPDPDPWLEVIIDPVLANLRLKDDGQGRVRLACHRMDAPAADDERAQRVTATLREIQW